MSDRHLQGDIVIDDIQDRKLARMTRKAEKLSDRGDEAGAVVQWERCLVRLDELGDRSTAWWYHAVIADALFELGDHPGTLTHANAALLVTTDNPLIWLRFGQAAFELGDLDGAANGLMSAYMLMGPELFEDEEPKYLQFLASRANLA